MLKTFHCPNCHASLEHNTNDQAVSCPYCGTTVIVPEELRVKSAARNARFDVYSDQSMNTLVEVAKLVRNGQTQEAVWLYQEEFGVSEHEARRVVRQMEQGQVVQIGRSVTQAVDYETIAKPVRRSCAGVIITLVILFVGIGVAGVLIFNSLAQTAQDLVPAAVINAVSTAVPGEEGLVAAEVMETVGAIMPEAGDLLVTPESTFANVALAFGEEGTGPGRFNDTRSLGADAEGFVYTGDWEDGRVQVFDREGKFITTWNANVDIIQNMVVSRQGTVFIVRARTLYAFNGQTGELLYQKELEDSVSGIFANIDGGFSIYYGSIIEDHYVRYDAQGNEVERFTGIVSNYDEEFVPQVQAIALDGAGNILFLTREAILKFGPEGNFVNRIGSNGDAEDQFRTPNSMALDGRGRIFVADLLSFKVFDNDGRFIASIPYPKPGAVFFSMTITDDDTLIAIDRNGNQVVAYNINE